MLMAVVNAKYEFTMIDVGDAGRQSDGGVFSASKLGFAINNNLLNLPPQRILPGTEKYFPYVFVGDEAFPLKTYLVKPYSRKALVKTSKLPIIQFLEPEGFWDMRLSILCV